MSRVRTRMLLLSAEFVGVCMGQGGGSDLEGGLSIPETILAFLLMLVIMGVCS